MQRGLAQVAPQKAAVQDAGKLGEADTPRTAGECNAGAEPHSHAGETEPQPATASALQESCKRKRGKHRKRSKKFLAVTYNPMGGTTAEASIRAILRKNPDAIIIPEAKISSAQQRRNLYRRLLGKDYVLRYSLLPGGNLLSNKGKEPRTSAGVIVAIAKRHTTHNSLAEGEVPTDLAGYVSHVQLTPPGGRGLDVVGVYMPTDSNEQHIRQLASAFICRLARLCKQKGATLLVGGDWNATLRDADRSTGGSRDADTWFRTLVETAQLTPVGGLPKQASQPRTPTYRQHVVGGEAVKSRIDDILVCLPTLPGGGQDWKPVGCTIPVVGDNSDHDPLLAYIPTSHLGYEQPPPQAAIPFRSQTKFRVPMNTDELRRFHDAFLAAAGTQQAMREFERTASTAAKQLEQAHLLALAETSEPAAYTQAFQRIARQQQVPPSTIEDMASQLHELLATALEIAHANCTTYNTTDRQYLARTTNREIAKLNRETCLLKLGLRELESMPDAASLDTPQLVAALQRCMEAEVERSTAQVNNTQKEGKTKQANKRQRPPQGAAGKNHQNNDLDEEGSDTSDSDGDEPQESADTPRGAQRRPSMLSAATEADVAAALETLQRHMQEQEAVARTSTTMAEEAVQAHRHQETITAEKHTNLTPPTGGRQGRRQASRVAEKGVRKHQAPGGHAQPPTPFRLLVTALQAGLQEQRQRRRSLLRTGQLKAWGKAVAAWRARYQRQPKWAHKDITNSTADTPRGIEVLRDPATGKLTSSPEERLGILRAQRKTTADAPPTGKAGGFSTDMPDSAEARGYPWSQPGAPDKLEIVTRVGPGHEREDLLPKIKDYSLFQRILKNAANQKATGWDGVPNELLKHLPSTLHKGIHHMFVAMWLTGETPTAWKRSHTIMLYKKGDPTNPANYRPIGLALTVYKLWTAILTETLAGYADSQGILSDSQRGFRQGRNTHQQLRGLMNALEDARLFKRDIFLLYIDFSSAFDMVDHDKLLQLMWDLGFPLHAVQAVQKLYSGASTCIRTAFGESEPIPIERGTLQGDSLSPFLFLLFIEPLLRWLREGGKGYRHGCGEEGKQDLHACSALAYADDLVVTTRSAAHMRAQADKVTLYLHWSGMEVNHKKCGVTGMLHGGSPGPALGDRAIHHLQTQLTRQVPISGKTVPFLHPHNEAYRYLGVLVTPSLNWRHQIEALGEAVIEKADGILRSMASSTQKLRLIETLLRPYIRYSLSTGAYTSADIAHLDSLLVRAAKCALHLPCSTPTTLVQEDKERGGIGVTSLEETYVAELTAKLTSALNDDGTLGYITHRLLQAQISRVGAMLDGGLANSLRHSSLLRTITLLAGAGGTMMRFTSPGHAEWYNLLGSELTSLLERLRHDPTELGTQERVPAARFLPLLEAGVTSLSQLLEPGGTHMVVASGVAEHLRRHNVQVDDSRGLRLAHNRLTACLNTPCEHGAPSLAGVTAADLPRDRRQLRATHLFQGLDPGPKRGRYPNGQRTVHEFLQTEGEPAGRTGSNSMETLSTESAGDTPGSNPQARPPAATQDTGDSVEAAEQTPASQAEPGRRRRCRRPAARPDPAYSLREEDSAHWADFLREFRDIYYHDRRLRERYAACPPPDLPRRGPVQLTPRLHWWMKVKCREPKVVHHIYREEDNALRVVGEATRAKFVGRGKARRRVKSQEGWIVEWAPYAIYKPHLPLAEALGYRATSVSACRTFGSKPPLIRVQWQPSFEPKGKFETDVPNAELLIAEYRARRAAERAEQAAADRQRLQAQHSLEERLAAQGIPAHKPFKWEYANSTAPALIHLETEAAHPELDVTPPPGTTHPFIRTAPPDVEQWSQPVAHVHERTGAYLGSITCERLAQLRTRYNATRAGKPELFARLQAGTFEEEVACLLRSWKSCTRRMEASKVQEQHGVAPSALIHAVQSATGADTELFASPLNVHPGMAAYFSSAERDQLFGASYDAYSKRWAGACFAHPPENATELEKAVRWALASAREGDRQRPVLTVLLLPSTSESAPYQRWLAYPEVVQLAHFSTPRSMPREAADSWQGKCQRYLSEPCPGYLLVAIGNRAGREQLLRQDMHRSFTNLPSQLGRLPGDCPWPWTESAGGQLQYDLSKYNAEIHRQASRHAETRERLNEHYRPPRKLATAASDTSVAWRMPASTEQPDAATAEQIATLYSQRQYQPRYEWQQALFTDGSVIKTEEGNLVGAAVWRAGDGATLINTNGAGPDDTITRAELAAIRHAVCDRLRVDEEGDIFTDSLASIHLIATAVRRPHRLKGTLHKEILMEIAGRLVERANAGTRTHIVKVMAHKGVKGNEEADAAAKQAAQPNATHDCTTPAHVPFEGLWRPAFHKPPSSEDSEREAPQAVANLKQALTKELHASLKTGSSKTGLYMKGITAMYDGQEGDRALGKESNGITLRSRQGQARAIRLRTKHLTGNWYNKSTALKRRAAYPPGGPLATDDMCPLCRQGRDSSGHLLLRCPRLKAMHIHRHNRATRIIQAALQRHSTHGSAYTIMDACPAAEAASHDVQGTRLPPFLLLNVPEEQRAKWRPDILRIIGLPPTPTEGDIQLALARRNRYTVQVVEVGYCSDTRWRETVKKKLEQHNDLINALAAEGWKVSIEPSVIVLGAMGTVYLSGEKALQALGMSPTHSSAVLAELHFTSIEAMTNITLARRRMEKSIRHGCKTGVG
jgi:ribonuclease HI